MTMQLTERPGGMTILRGALVPELLKDELADLLAWSIEMKQLLWNLEPPSSMGLGRLLGDAIRDGSRWMDRVAERLSELGIAPSTACARPLLRPDPSGGRSLDGRRAGMIAAHLTGELARRTTLRGEDGRMSDAASRHLLGAIERELEHYAILARQPERLVR